MATRLAAANRLLLQKADKTRAPRIVLAKLQRRTFVSTSQKYAEVASPRQAADADGSPRPAKSYQRMPKEPLTDYIHVPIPAKKDKAHKNLWSPAFLRDSCTCPQCVDPSTKQKTFATTDIPSGIKPSSVEVQSDGGVKIKWAVDVPGFDPDHVSVFPFTFFNLNHSPQNILKDRSENIYPITWNASNILKKLDYINYNDYMTKDESLLKALLGLQVDGIVLIKGLDKGDENALEKLAGRIGPIRDTLYGRTWDVKSIPNAKNVAYTQKNLGLHQDLLYMKNPPAYQFLHCLENSTEGGNSIFSDSFLAVKKLHFADREILSKWRIPYEYRNDGQHYHHRHPIIEYDEDTRHEFETIGAPRNVKYVNYSPPFQATLIDNPPIKLPQFFRALRAFAAAVESPKNVFEYKLEPGECVIFNNRRILHGRKQFDAEEKRWLKGTYVDEDVLMSKLRVVNESLSEGMDIRWSEAYSRAKYQKLNADEGARAEAEAEELDRGK